MQKIIFQILVLFLVMLTVTNCSKSSSEGGKSSSQSPIPNATAIVKATLPGALESTAALSVQGISVLVNSDLQTLKDRIFSPGPVDFLYRMASVDSRLTELADSILECEKSGPVASLYTPPTVATGFSFPMMLSCKVNIEAAALGVSDMKVYFGKSSGFWYVAILQTNANYESNSGSPPTIGTLAKVDESGQTAEIFQISSEKVASSYKSTILHIKANKSTGVFEISTASSAQNFSESLSPGANYSGVGCGVMMKTNGTLVYSTGKFNQLTVCPATTSICADSNLADATGCTGVVDTFSVLDLTNRAVIDDTAVKSLLVTRTWLTGL